jgi:predicted amidophosphoribosyltransferase
MIELYCRRHEGNVHPCGEYRGRDGNLCDECRRLLEYAERRLDACRYGDAKPVCRKCPTHCYRPDHRAKIREVMRYAGPRLILHHPMEAITHILRGWRGS